MRGEQQPPTITAIPATELNMTTLFKFKYSKLDRSDCDITGTEEGVNPQHIEPALWLTQGNCLTTIIGSWLDVALPMVRWMIDAILLMTILLLLLRRNDHVRVIGDSAYEVGGDFTGVSPHCKHFLLWNTLTFLTFQVSVEVKTFNVNQTFAPYNTTEFFKAEVLTAWNELMPRKFPSYSVRIKTKSSRWDRLSGTLRMLTLLYPTL